jgi:glucose/arabinose dehydrogenase
MRHLLAPLLLAAVGCGNAAEPGDRCMLVASGFGPDGSVPIRVETVVSGLEVPWGIAFLPGGDLLVTERPGRLRLVTGGRLVETPVARLPVTSAGEGGLLGIVLDPAFTQNHRFFLYYTGERDGRTVNRIERWRLADDERSAVPDRIVLDGIPAARYHDGGRLRFGPDGMLWAGTGDGTEPERSQDRDSLSGKLLRITPDGQVPPDNPWPGNPAWLMGVRNVEAFDWSSDRRLYVADHGPSGELGRTGHDEVSLAGRGANLGWPTIWGCGSGAGMVVPALTWNAAVPPGGAAFYTGHAIPEWRGSLLVGTLRSQHLHRIVFDANDPARVASHEVYLRDRYGRLRDVVMGPDAELYVTTSNCDGRGTCPPEKDAVLRVTR